MFNLLHRPLEQSPPRTTRAAIALAIAVYGTTVFLLKQRQFPDHPGDFGVAWFGALALFHNANPYALVGPGLVYYWPWKLLYPATAMVAAAPFALFPLLYATGAFVFLSTILLAYAITADGWYRLPIFVTSSFVAAAAFAQWSVILTAALLIPQLALIFAAKPNVGLALTAAAPCQLLKWALIGGTVLATISLLVMPSWPSEWFASMSSDAVKPPILSLAGPTLLLALLRWRRWEARLILALACVPQTTYWYDALPLFLIPSSITESVLLALIGAVGMLIEQHWLVATSEIQHYQQIGTLMVILIYLPATILVLRRPNVSSRPGWHLPARLGSPPSREAS